MNFIFFPLNLRCNFLTNRFFYLLLRYRSQITHYVNQVNSQRRLKYFPVPFGEIIVIVTEDSGIPKENNFPLLTHKRKFTDAILLFRRNYYQLNLNYSFQISRLKILGHV